MGTQQDFTFGFKLGLRQWRIAAIVYFLQLCLAMTVGMQVYDVLQASIGHSLEINKLLENYDHTVITDFLKVHGASITPLIGQLRWLLLAWLLFSVFVDGGLLFCATKPPQASGRAFWEAGARYYFAFLKISVLFLLMALLWAGLLFVPLLTFFQPSLQYFSSEKGIVWLGIAAVLLLLFIFGLLFLWSVLTRVHHIRTGASVWASLQAGWRVMRQNKLRLISLLGLFALFQLSLMALYFLVEAMTGMRSAGLIVLVFFLQQAFVFFRVQVRIMMYAAIGQSIKA